MFAALPMVVARSHSPFRLFRSLSFNSSLTANLDLVWRCGSESFSTSLKCFLAADMGERDCRIDVFCNTGVLFLLVTVFLEIGEEFLLGLLDEDFPLVAEGDMTLGDFALTGREEILS